MQIVFISAIALFITQLSAVSKLTLSSMTGNDDRFLLHLFQPMTRSIPPLSLRSIRPKIKIPMKIAAAYV